MSRIRSLLNRAATPNTSRNALPPKEIISLPKRGNELFLFQAGVTGRLLNFFRAHLATGRSR